MHAWAQHKCLVSLRGADRRGGWLSGRSGRTTKQKESSWSMIPEKKEAAVKTDEGRRSDEPGDAAECK